MGLRTQHSELTEISDRNFEASLESKYALEAHGMDGTGRIENGTVTVHRLPFIRVSLRIHPTHIGGVRGDCGRNTHGTSTVVLSDFVRGTLIRAQRRCTKSRILT